MCNAQSTTAYLKTASGSVALSFFPFLLFLLFQPIFYFGLPSVTFRLSFRTSKRHKNIFAVVNQEDLPANRFNKNAIFRHPMNM